jgi:hypothetical protein
MTADIGLFDRKAIKDVARYNDLKTGFVNGSPWS